MPASSNYISGLPRERASSAPSRSRCRLLDVIKHEVGPDNVEISLGFVGMQPSNLPHQYDLSLDSGSEEAVLQVQLKRGAGMRHRGFEGAAASEIAPMNCRAYASRSSPATSSAG